MTIDRSEPGTEGRMEEIIEARMELEALREAYGDLRERLVTEGEERRRKLKAELSPKYEMETKEIQESKISATKDLDELRQRAIKDGYEQGLKSGIEEGRQRGLEESRRLAQEKAELLARGLLESACEKFPGLLERCIEDFERCWHETVGEMRRDTVALSRGIAERILRRELPELPNLVIENIDIAVQRISDQRQLRIEVHPADLALVVQFLPDLNRKIKGAEAAEVVGEDSIRRGGCRVRSETGFVDMSIDTQLDLIESALVKNSQVAG